MTSRSVILVAAVCMQVLAACSTVETTPGSLPISTILHQDESIQLKVSSGNPQDDKILYETAFQQFSTVMPLKEQGPYTGSLEITFASATQSAFVGSASTFGTANVTSSGWYSGGQYSGVASGFGTGTTVASGGTFDWQNSTMIAVLKHSDGQRIWSADYTYKGGWELSGWVVNTPEDAMRLVAGRLKDQFVADLKK